MAIVLIKTVSLHRQYDRIGLTGPILKFLFKIHYAVHSTVLANSTYRQLAKQRRTGR